MKAMMKLLSVMMSVVLVVGLCPTVAMAKGGDAGSGAMLGAASGTQVSTQDANVSNPRVVEDSSMKAGQKATWDCVWFGSYPQDEVTASDVSGLASASWDASGDAWVGGQRYRRISRADATYSGYWGSGAPEYRYFRYSPIKWRVLEVSGGEALLLADRALDGRRYNEEYASVTWATSTVRSWLNGYGASSNSYGADYSAGCFKGAAFSASEWGDVKTASLENADNPYYRTSGGAGTSDKVFLLSLADVCGDAAPAHGFASGYSTYDEARRSKASDYGTAMGAWRSNSGGSLGNCWWWLRFPGYDSGYAAVVDDGGLVGRRGYYVDSSRGAVRPALRISLSSNHLSPAGTVCSDGTVDETAPTGTGGSGSDNNASYGANKWKFSNSPTYFEQEGDDYYIMQNEYDRYMSALPKADRERMFRWSSGIPQFRHRISCLNPAGALPNGYYKEWDGSCYGMSAWSFLAASGRLKASYLGGYSRLSSVPFTGGSESAINFYQFQQRTRIFQQRQRAFKQQSQAVQLRQLDTLAEGASANHPFLISFYWKRQKDDGSWEDVGHTVVGYGKKTGSWRCTVGGMTEGYAARVQIYDCAQPKKGESACLYYDLSGNRWCIPAWGVRSISNQCHEDESDNGLLGYLESDPAKVDIVDISTGAYSQAGESVSAAFLENGTSLSYSLTANGKAYFIDGLTAEGPDGDVVVVGSIGEGESDNEDEDSDEGDGEVRPSDSYTAVFTDGGALTTARAEGPIDFSLSSQGSYTHASAGVGGEVEFGADGSCAVEADSETDILVAVAPDSADVLGFDDVSVEADGASRLSIGRSGTGLLVSGDDLSAITCSGTDLDDVGNPVDLAVSSGKKAVLVAQEGSGLAAFEDADGDGSFETRIAMTSGDSGGAGGGGGSSVDGGPGKSGGSGSGTASSGQTGGITSNQTDSSIGLGIGASAKVKGCTYEVTGASTATFKKAKNAKSVAVPATVKLGGATYKVTKVAAKAFTGSKIRTVKLGKNVSKLAKKAFSKSKVKKLVVQTKKLAKPSSVKGSFKGSKAKELTVKYGKAGKKKVAKSFTAKNLGVKAVMLKK